VGQVKEKTAEEVLVEEKCLYYNPKRRW